jgi:predicted DNA repair protein MutK
VAALSQIRGKCKLDRAARLPHRGASIRFSQDLFPMPTGLVALLDDIAVIAKAAAASIDDVGVAAAKAGSKAAGVVIDDAAVTPSYVTEFTPDRELPIIWQITKGSLRNKLLILLPAALVLSALLPWAITPLLMLGALFLCYEGAEKVMEKLGGEHHGDTLEDPITDIAEFERERISGAVRTDFILSAEIMAIALAEVATEPLLTRAMILALVAVVITAGVYGTVALIVKMDDIGLHLVEKRHTRGEQALGRGLLHAMPKLLAVLSAVGTIAMLWVGGGIMLHGGHELGLHAPSDLAHAIQHAVEHATGALGGVLGWVTYAGLSALVGLVLGAIVAIMAHKVFKLGAH